MKSRQLIIPLTIISLSTLAIYLLIAYAVLREPAVPAAAAKITSPAAASLEDALPEPGPQASAAPEKTVAETPAIAGGRKRLEIFGRVQDRQGQPIAGVLVAEERYFATARSDAGGNYAIPLELPRHRYPVLHFLHAGYDSQRIRLRQSDLGEAPRFRLDVELGPDLYSIDFAGWVGNDLGMGLEGAHVELTATYPNNKESFYLTDFTDESGRFRFEGVHSGQTYRLAVDLAPDYRGYENTAFFVSPNPAPASIVLQPLEFVDADGMLLTRDLEPVPNYEIYVNNLATTGDTRKIVSDSSGFFTLPHFPVGEVILSTRGAEHYRIAGMRIDAGAYQNLQIIVDRGSHYLSGWVADENGVAVEKAMVTLNRKFSRGEVEHTSYRSQSTGSDGQFSFERLGGGEHRVTVYAWGYEKQEFIHRFGDQADEIFITLKRED